MKSTGGSWSPGERRQRHFLAGDWQGLCPTAYQQHPDILVAASILGNERYRDHLAHMLDAGVQLDSGIFSLTADYARQTGRPIADAFKVPPEDMPGFGQLWDRYLGLLQRHGHQLWGYVECDLGGVDSKRRLRARIEAEGFTPIPVYHPLFDGWAYFDELAGDYDRVCVANMADQTSETRKRLLLTTWERHRKYPDLWVHALGVTPSEWLTGFPCDSVDSSSWLGGVRWGSEAGAAYLDRVGALPLDYRYAASGQTAKAVQLGAANAHFHATTWQRIADSLTDDLGTVAYPPVLAGEPQL